MRAWFHLVARQRSPELFVLNVLLVTLGLAALTELAGLSLALGAFLAGMLIAETEYRYQVEEDIKPFRDVLLGLFFITIGMMLDLRVVGRARSGWCCCCWSCRCGQARADRRCSRARSARRSRTALRTGFYLAQAGEFALVMLALAHAHRLLVADVHADRAGGDGAVDAARAAADPVRRAVGAQADGQRLARARRAGDAGRRARRWRARTT